MKCCKSHSFHDIEELHTLRKELLSWYDNGKRDLPWRSVLLHSEETDINIRAYGVWVSEVMLQQTQVSTVLDCYIKWMKRWPTVESLAAAKLEEVHAMWAGLGYYSRGERLWKGAQKVVSEMGGIIPDTPEELVKGLPGVGRYTAGAIASIAFNKVTGIVDGNVVRVLCRQKAIGAESSCQTVTKHLWALAEACVDPERPGDFNQAVMELGATVCSPKSPQCQRCPIKASCHALQRVRGTGLGCGSKIEEKCPLCLAEWSQELGVTNYPHKTKKKAPRLEEYCVAVIEDEEGQFLLKQRSPTGLLAGLWEFPSVPLAGGSAGSREEKGQLQQLLEHGEEQWRQLLQAKHHQKVLPKPIGKVTHQFSHLHHVYHCWHVVLDSEGRDHATPSRASVGVVSASPAGGAGLRWVARDRLAESAIPASVKKIVTLLDSQETRKRTSTSAGTERKRQKKLDSFFQKKE